MAKYRLKDKSPEHYMLGRSYFGGDVMELPDSVVPSDWFEALKDEDSGASAPETSSGKPKPSKRGKAEQPTDDASGDN